MTDKPFLFILTYSTLSGAGGHPWGVFSSLEHAKTEAQRHTKTPLEWVPCDIDKPFRKYYWAKMLDWKTSNSIVEVYEIRLDAKHFRP